MFWNTTHFTKKPCLQNQQNQKLWSEIIGKKIFFFHHQQNLRKKKTFSETDGNNEFFGKIFLLNLKKIITVRKVTEINIF